MNMMKAVATVRSIILLGILVRVANGLLRDDWNGFDRQRWSTSCFVNRNVSFSVIKAQPSHLISRHGSDNVFHERIAIAVKTEQCDSYKWIEFRFELSLFESLHSHSISDNLKYFHSPTNWTVTAKKFRSYLGVATVIYSPLWNARRQNGNSESETKTETQTGKVSLTFLGDIGDIESCLHFSAKVWTNKRYFEMQPTVSGADLSHSCVPMSVTMTSQHSSNVDLIIPSNVRKLQQMFEFDDCFDNQYLHTHTVKIGLLVDNGFLIEFDNSTDRILEFLETAFTDMNGIYENQLNVYLSMGDVLAGNVAFFDFNDAPQDGDECCSCSIQSSMTVQLTSLYNWNTDWYDWMEANCSANGLANADCPTYDSHSVWVLLSKCEWGGRAWTKVLCRKDGYNSAVVNWYYSDTWRVLAHELGHVFGASHSFENGTSTTGGIMDYGDGTYLDVYQFHPYRKSEICAGINSAMRTTNSRVTDCWTVKDYGSITYRWRQTGDYGQCTPVCGNNRLSLEDIECVMSDADGEISVVSDTECNVALKPTAKFTECDSVTCDDAICGDYIWDQSEQCDTGLDSDCCNSDCSRVSSTDCHSLDPRIDAAFTKSDGKLYLFHQSQFSVYASIDDKQPQTGYPKLISEAFPISLWSSDLNGAFATSDDIAYIFKDFSYVRVDLTASTADAQLDNSAQSVSNGHFGRMPTAFKQCGTIDAAFVVDDSSAVLVCGSIYYEFTIGSNGVDDLYRPLFSDFDVSFSSHLSDRSSIDAAAYDWQSGKIRLYNGDQYTEYYNGQQLSGTPTKHTPMGYWSESDAGCVSDGCVFCSNGDHICDACDSGYSLHNDECWDDSYLVMIEFEDSLSDEAYIDTDLSTALSYDSNGAFGNGLLLTHSSQTVVLYRPNLINFTQSTLDNWQFSLYLLPLNDSIHADNQTFLTITNSDLSLFQFTLQPNKECNGSAPTVIHRNAADDYERSVVFSDYSCDMALPYFVWNKFTLKSTVESFQITVNGYSQSSPYFEFDSTFDFSIDIQQWYFGNGFVGGIDHFIFQSLDSNVYSVNTTVNASDGTIPIGSQGCAPSPFPWTKVVSIGVASIVGYTLLLFGGYICVTAVRANASGNANRAQQSNNANNAIMMTPNRSINANAIELYSPSMNRDLERAVNVRLASPARGRTHTPHHSPRKQASPRKQIVY